MGTTTPYKRRPSLVRRVWFYRYLIAAAMVLGLLLWFVLINNAPVTVYFPFGLGQLASTAGIVILLSAGSGAVAAWLVLLVVMAVRKMRAGSSPADDEPAAPLTDERPPADYASKTTEGFSGSRWAGHE